MTIERHIIKEILKSFSILTLLLMVLLISTELSDTLTKVLTGQYSNNAIWIIIGLQIPVLSAELIPGSYFLALLTTLYRQMQDNERAVYHTMAKSDADLLKTLLVKTSIPVMIVVILLTNIGAPLANKATAEYISAQLNRPITDLIQPKAFLDIPNTSTTLYASEASSEQGQLRDVVAIQKNSDRFSVIQSNILETQGDEKGQYFIFADGQITEYGFATGSDTTYRSFDSLSIRIPNSTPTVPRIRNSAKSTAEILDEDNYGRDGQLILLNRIFAGLFIPMFCALAVALTRFKPRSPKVGALIVGITFYVLSNFIYNTIRSAFSKTDLSLWLSPWWLFMIVILFSLFLINRRV